MTRTNTGEIRRAQSLCRRRVKVRVLLIASCLFLISCDERDTIGKCEMREKHKCQTESCVRSVREYCFNKILDER